MKLFKRKSKERKEAFDLIYRQLDARDQHISGLYRAGNILDSDLAKIQEMNTRPYGLILYKHIGN